jgi:ABC-type transport system substrate-binding protein
VLFSWERYKTLSAYASIYSVDVAPTAPWVNLEAPDESTVVINLAYPYAPHDVMTAYFAALPIYPAEADGGFDPKTDARGSAAWRVKEWLPSARLEFEKNPSYYGADDVFIDGINFILISEYATRLSQFRAGSLMNFGGQTFGSGAAQEDILPIIKDLSNVKLYVSEDFDRGGNPIKFAQIENSMFADDRIRIAMSMLLDRDLLAETMYNPGPLEDAGLPVELRWDTGIPAGEEWWLDPKSSEFGESAKNLMYNPEEAKKLLSAAGITTPIESRFWVSNGYPGSEYERESAIIQGMFEATGDFKLPIEILDHNTDFRNNVIFNRTLNDQDVVAYVGGASTEPDVDIWFDRWYGRVARQGEWPLDDDTMNDFVTRQRQALEREERASIVRDFQRYQASKLHNIWAGGASSNFLLIHDFIGNAALWRAKGGGSPQNETWTYLWLDKSKM